VSYPLPSEIAKRYWLDWSLGAKASNGNDRNPRGCGNEFGSNGAADTALAPPHSDAAKRLDPIYFRFL
jgi:hypothetical protein